MQRPSRLGVPAYLQLLSGFAGGNASLRPYQTEAQGTLGTGHMMRLGAYFDQAGSTGSPARFRATPSPRSTRRLLSCSTRAGTAHEARAARTARVPADDGAVHLPAAQRRAGAARAIADRAADRSPRSCSSATPCRRRRSGCRSRPSRTRSRSSLPMPRGSTASTNRAPPWPERSSAGSPRCTTKAAGRSRRSRSSPRCAARSSPTPVPSCDPRARSRT